MGVAKHRLQQAVHVVALGLDVHPKPVLAGSRARDRTDGHDPRAATVPRRRPSPQVLRPPAAARKKRTVEEEVKVT
ncbi:MAG: hypothetical protein WKF31_09375 [Thermoleophilaceae bacterium]